LLTAFRIRYIVRLDEALEPDLPACAARLAVILILGTRDPADGANLVNWVERMSACREPIKPRRFHVFGDPASAVAVEGQFLSPEVALRLAETSSPDVAQSLRIIAADYLEKASDLSRTVKQQQQQIQPKEPEGEGT
jgi:hypothetical protein